MAKTNPSFVELAELCDAVYGAGRTVEIKLPGAPVPLKPPDATFIPLRQDLTLMPLKDNLLTGGIFGSTPLSGEPTWFTPPPAHPVERKITWKMTMSWRNAVGFHCATYARTDDETTVLAFRGTDDLWDGLVDDAAVAFGRVPPQVQAALQVARSARLGKDTYVTGHSLGGALAIITAAHLDVPAVTYNAPGVMDSCVQSSGDSGLVRMMDILRRCLANRRILNKRINGDPVSSFFSTGWQTGGRTRPLSGAQCGLDALCRHGIGTCIAALKQDEQNFLPLKL